MSKNDRITVAIASLRSDEGAQHGGAVVKLPKWTL